MFGGHRKNLLVRVDNKSINFMSYNTERESDVFLYYRLEASLLQVGGPKFFWNL